MIARLVAFVIPLGIDTFVVAAALGLSKPTRRQRVRIGALFAGSKAACPSLVYSWAHLWATFLAQQLSTSRSPS